MNKRKFQKILWNRVGYTLFFITLQVAALVLMFQLFRASFAYYYAICIFISAIAVFHVLSGGSNPAYKIAWVIPILIFPIFGGLFYMMFRRGRLSRRERKRMTALEGRYQAAMRGSDGALDLLLKENPDAALHARYLLKADGAPPYRHTQTRFFPLGEDLFASLMVELAKAEKYVFLEYFIIEEGKMWDSVLELLTEKAKAGVDVRVLYDDLGCVFTLPTDYARSLASRGIKACAFNRFNSVVSSRFNNRDHRKICVIDGEVGYTGGINLADEYINERVKYGHWKDNGVMLRGEAVWSLAVMFLTMWDFVRGVEEDLTLFAPDPARMAAVPSDGYVQPYTDSPLDDEPVGETVYMNLISRARRYVYVTTPYLIVDNELLTALRTAAKSGVDVRIITPRVPDKKLVFLTTRSYYKPLIEAGVRIYEYVPGFIHGKICVCDDEYAVVGTINFDFRSLYLHYECAAWMYKSRAVAQVYADFEKTMRVSEEITADFVRRTPLLKRFFMNLLRIFAPLM